MLEFLRQNITVPLSPQAQTLAETVIDVVVFASSRGKSIEAAVVELTTLHGKKVPSADTVIEYLKRMSIEQVDEEFLCATAAICRTARRRRLLPPGRAPMSVAIDLHDIPYYGDKNDPMVVRGKAKAGTRSSFRMATAYVVIRGQRYTFGVVPVHSLDHTDDVVRRLLDIAGRWIRVRLVLLDRGFYSVPMINLLKGRGLYLMPPVRKEGLRKKIKQAWAEGKSMFPHTIKSQDYGSAETNILLAMSTSPKVRFSEDPMVDFWRKVLVFATNLEPADAASLKHLPELYRKRFGIESSYRMMKQNRVRTCTKCYCLRYFYFLLSVTLYNLWVYANQVKARIEGSPNREPVKPERQAFMLAMFAAVILDGMDT
jgi:putative transposase